MATKLNDYMFRNPTDMRSEIATIKEPDDAVFSGLQFLLDKTVALRHLTMMARSSKKRLLNE